MAYSDMQAAGSNAYVARLIKMGKSALQIVESLTRRFPSELKVSIAAAYRYGQAAYDAALRFAGLAPGEKLPAGGVPLGGGPPAGFRYYAVAEVWDPATGTVNYREIQVETPGKETRESVLQRLLDDSRDFFQSSRSRAGSEPEPRGAVVVGVDVFAIERTHL